MCYTNKLALPCLAYLSAGTGAESAAAALCIRSFLRFGEIHTTLHQVCQPYAILFYGIPKFSTSIESPREKQSFDIPTCYAPFSNVFCLKRASQLPPHRPWDCAIYLLPGESVPRGRIYPLSLPEQKAMEEYIKEALQQGYICPSTSPAASSFFFLAKKDGSLQHCIVYRTLKKIRVKLPYPLPLVPAAFQHLRKATVFCKLDLRSMHDLIRIHEGDEWKTAFVTPTGH